ncbi:MAG TPA: hypothetical protein VF848_00180, partial [Steroidobacteraceae bacterium]
MGYAGLALYGLLRFGHGRSPAANAVSLQKALRAYIGVAITATALWLWCQTAQMSGVGLLEVSRSDLIYVLTGTHSGTLALTRLALLVAALLLALIHAWQRPRQQVSHAILGVALLGTLAGSGHGMMDVGVSGLVHLSGDMLHLLAGAIWVGALIALLLELSRAIRTRTMADVTETHRALSWFSGIGIVVVAVLIFSGLINSWFLIGPSRMLRLYH